MDQLHNHQQTSTGRVVARILLLVASISPIFGQSRASSQFSPTMVAEEAPRVNQSAPLTLTLKDALERAQKNDPQFLSAVSNAKLAREDRVQARASLLPSLGLRSEFLNAQGNGVNPESRFITNDGVHVYREWSMVHQDLSPTTLTRTGYRLARAIEALAQAKAEVARRGLAVTVTRAYYTLLNAQRKYATAQQALDQGKRFLDISQKLESGGEVAHSDVVKSELQYTVQDQALREAQLTMETARLELAVLLFRDFDENFQIVDDLHLAPALPSFAEIRAMAERENPDLRVAMTAVRTAELDISSAHQAFLPTLTVDYIYGIEANAIALRSVYVATDVGPAGRLGYFLTATLNFPVWDWGARKSRLRQAEIKRQQANVELSAAQRQLLKNLSGAYQEARVAREHVDLLRHSSDLATESLRLNTLRYQGGEATVLDVVDAQNSLTLARNALNDGEVRYRFAIANLQALTGNF
jgi:outer membrane protein TolC